MSGYDAFLGSEEDLTPQSSSRPFDSDGYIGYDPRLPSQRFEPFEMSEEQFRESKDDELNGMDSNGFTVNNTCEDYEGSAQPSEAPSAMFGHGFENGHQSGFTSDFGVNGNENGVDNGLVDGEVNGIYGAMTEVASDGPILPDLHEMQPEEGFALREWRRENAIRLEEKERREKEELIRIIDEAESYREEFYNKRKKHRETNKNNNREKEKVYVANQEKFHANADKEYWKAIAELIPHELPTIETKKGSKDKNRNPIVVNHGPKPGNPTDLSLMRQILLKLKHKPPPHMKPALPTAAAAAADGSGPVLSAGMVVAVTQSTASAQAVAAA